MSAEHAEFAEWDAAYALGALSPADRRLFEAHLEQCDLCRAAVAELASMPGLLSRVPAERAMALGRDDDAAGPRAELRDDVVTVARRRRSRRRAGWIGAVAAAVLVVAAIAVPLSLGAVPRGEVHALNDLADVPIEASVRLVDADWGTRIDLVCRYSGEVLDAPEGGWPYALAVVDGEGSTTTLSTWRAAPGSTTELSAGTDLEVADIGAVEIRTVDGETVLMRYAAG